MPIRAFLATAMVIFLAPCARAEPLVLCGWDKVLLLETSAAGQGKIEKIWTWDASLRKELPENVRTAFRTTDDCKPVDNGSRVLISSSSGGCAVVEKPLFRFAQVNDLHVQATEPPLLPRQRTYKSANEKARWVVDTINATLLPPVDFVVGVGDLIHGEGLERLEPDLRAFGELIKPLRCPLHPVVGNHEVVQQERSPQYLRPWREAFGRDLADYTFTHGGILFVALNNSGAPNADAARQRNHWLRSVLSAARDRPKIVLCHIPLIPLRDEATLAKSFGFASYRDRDPGTLNLIEEHRDTVIAVLSGHLHLTGMKQQRGIFHVSIAGTASYPCDFAVYEVFPDRIEVVVKQLPERLAKTEASIHGKERHSRDFTDSEHRSAEEYQSGRADERRFTIPLSVRKGSEPVSEPPSCRHAERSEASEPPRSQGDPSLRSG